MAAFQCQRHGIQGVTIMCEHVADAMDTQRSLGFELSQTPHDHRLVRCRGCVAAGVTLNRENLEPACNCSACFDEWAAGTNGQPRSC